MEQGIIFDQGVGDKTYSTNDFVTGSDERHGPYDASGQSGREVWGDRLPRA